MLDLLKEREAHRLPPPSIREICEKLGFKSTNAAAEIINSLETCGEITRVQGRARSIRLVRRPAVGIPLLGSIPAGLPVESVAETMESFGLDPTVFGIRNPHDAFALRVRGDSMTGRNFFDGDLVLFDRSAAPKHQDVVAALIDQECTLKTLVLKKGRAWLKAENPVYPDLAPAHDLQIQGVAKAVIRIFAT
ncbi:MAG: repressor LexA [Gloeobacteraceae cyanobacterium ES-bin-144]|nr:repressor LexA [Verrucomicrobiales bacterium]